MMSYFLYVLEILLPTILIQVCITILLCVHRSAYVQA